MTSAWSTGLLGLLFVVGAFGAENAFQAAALRLAPELMSLTSCAAPNGSGGYRVVVFNRGFEHVSSEVFVQWLDWDPDGPRVVKSVSVSEFGSGFMSVRAPVLLSPKDCSMQLTATHTYSLETTRFVLRPAGTGRYSLRTVGTK